MDDIAFAGFDVPRENWSKLPHDISRTGLHLIETLGEMKAILYILGHTWGFNNYDEPERLSFDELMHGRRYRYGPKKGQRMDAGTGLSKNTLKDGLARAVLHGFLEQYEDPDAGGQESPYLYGLKMRDTGGQKLTPSEDGGGQKLTGGESEIDPLPVGKSGTKRKDERKGGERQRVAPAPTDASQPAPPPQEDELEEAEATRIVQFCMSWSNGFVQTSVRERRERETAEFVKELKEKGVGRKMLRRWLHYFKTEHPFGKKGKKVDYFNNLTQFREHFSAWYANELATPQAVRPAAPASGPNYYNPSLERARLATQGNQQTYGTAKPTNLTPNGPRRP